ncbi:hypothetical protein TRAPUB_1454, partial [Trametes pubescens]
VLSLEECSSRDYLDTLAAERKAAAEQPPLLEASVPLLLPAPHLWPGETHITFDTNAPASCHQVGAPA